MGFCNYCVLCFVYTSETQYLKIAFRMGNFDILLRNSFSFNLGDEFFEFSVHLKVDWNKFQRIKVWLRILGIEYPWRWWLIKNYSLIYNVSSVWGHRLLINFGLKCKFNIWKRHWKNWILKNWGLVKVKGFLTWNYFNVNWWRKILKEVLIPLKNTLIFCLTLAFNYLFDFNFTWNVLVNKLNYLSSLGFASHRVFLLKFENFKSKQET